MIYNICTVCSLLLPGSFDDINRFPFENADFITLWIEEKPPLKKKNHTHKDLHGFVKPDLCVCGRWEELNHSRRGSKVLCSHSLSIKANIECLEVDISL